MDLTLSGAWATHQYNLVLSTGLIMWIGHCKEIRKVTFQALALRQFHPCYHSTPTQHHSFFTILRPFISTFLTWYFFMLSLQHYEMHVGCSCIFVLYHRIPRQTVLCCAHLHFYRKCMGFREHFAKLHKITKIWTSTCSIKVNISYIWRTVVLSAQNCQFQQVWRIQFMFAVYHTYNNKRVERPTS